MILADTRGSMTIALRRWIRPVGGKNKGDIDWPAPKGAGFSRGRRHLSARCSKQDCFPSMPSRTGVPHRSGRLVHGWEEGSPCGLVITNLRTLYQTFPGMSTPSEKFFCAGADITELFLILLKSYKRIKQAQSPFTETVASGTIECANNVRSGRKRT